MRDRGKAANPLVYVFTTRAHLATGYTWHSAIVSRGGIRNVFSFIYCIVAKPGGRRRRAVFGETINDRLPVGVADPVISIEGDANECDRRHGAAAADRVARTIEFYLPSFVSQVKPTLDDVRERARDYAGKIQATYIGDTREVAERHHHGAWQPVSDLTRCEVAREFGIDARLVWSRRRRQGVAAHAANRLESEKNIREKDDAINQQERAMKTITVRIIWAAIAVLWRVNSPYKGATPALLDLIGGQSEVPKFVKIVKAAGITSE